MQKSLFKNLWLVLMVSSLAYSSFSFGQKEMTNWFFGSSAGLDFNCNPPKTLSSWNQKEKDSSMFLPMILRMEFTATA
jgi:hypothetical protein